MKCTRTYTIYNENNIMDGIFCACPGLVQVLFFFEIW